MKKDILPIIREINQSELSFLDDMLYNAIFIPDGADKLTRDIINRPELSRYIKEFGQDDDYCFVAEIKGQLVGAIWIRMFKENEKGYGFVDTKTPELSMAVLEQFRNNGIGTLLLDKMLHCLEHKYFQVSLSVDEQNFAYGFYKKYGFVDYALIEKSVTMIKKLRN